MRRVLVTGGTGTLGSALTRELRAQGWEVVAGFQAGLERAERLIDETGCELWQGDMREEAAVAALFEAEAFSAVVHLAGAADGGLLLRTSSSSWRDTLDSHLTSSFLICRAALQTLPSGGKILLVSSRVGLVGNAGQSAYSAAKAGVLGLMRSAAIEGRERGIAVNAVCPGYAPAPDEVLSVKQQLARAREDLATDNDAAASFAAFVGWFLASNCTVSGQVLRPDCRIG